MDLCVITSILAVVASIGSIIMTLLIAWQRDFLLGAVRRLGEENMRLANELMRLQRREP